MKCDFWRIDQRIDLGISAPKVMKALIVQILCALVLISFAHLARAAKDASAVNAAVNATVNAGEGVEVGRQSVLRHLAPAKEMEAMAARQYDQLQKQAQAKGLLRPIEAVETQRLMKIARRLFPFVVRWNAKAPNWTWQLSLIQSDQVNAFCLPGGKIVFYTGIIEKLKLSDDEIAIVMAHEMAHVLREHGRERVGTQILIQGLGMVGAALGLGDKAYGLAGLAGRAIGSGAILAFSRSDESEADLIGLELAARAGYKPNAGISLWQKMTAINKKSSPQFLSTHPANKTRIADIERNLPQVLPFYERARSSESDRAP